MKYVMFCRRIGNANHYVPIIFPDTLVHSDVADAMLYWEDNKNRPPLYEYEPVSAGTVTLGIKGEVTCSGESETLQLVSDPARDATVISMNDYGAGASWD